ncbi:hypothetical protein M0L20_07165 [Spirosoma sp. RP8]|uniref:Uncharacterized protein n=1 Tax=Spirosoma liriopis TaxID=2937440 RepID=A0ABT0HHK2_9BACT|nr:hypothetical protein [Spirosoma liriopis]MCK8491628.1 hypothetical protein [Spirosoma liriopis]
MIKGLIRLSYRKIIDASSQKAWDKYVFDDTYQEFYMQAQSYNQDSMYSTFQELLTHVPEADKLHYLTSRAAIGYIRQLNGIVPEIVNASGKLCLPFTQFKFEILQSHVQNKELHKVAISFYSEPLTWIDTIGNSLLITYGDQRQSLHEGKEIETDLLALQPYLNVSFVQSGTLA